MGEVVPTFRRNVISSSSRVKRRIGFFLRPLDLQEVCITFLWNVENLPPSGLACPVSWTYSDGSCSTMYVCVAVQVPLPTACPVIIVLQLFVTASYQHRHSLTGTVCYAAQSPYSKQHSVQGNMTSCCRTKCHYLSGHATYVTCMRVCVCVCVCAHVIIIIFITTHCSLKAYCAILVRRSNFRHQASPRVSPRESTQRRKVELWARNVR